MDWESLLNKKRPRESTNPGDHRAEFERDFDRAVFSTPLKRLQDKTQVFPMEPNDAIRTRLAHSLEVSSVARGLGILVSQWLLEHSRIEPPMDRWIEAIAATCGLIHDLGSAPFGHFGEDAIRFWFKELDKIDPLRNTLDNNEQLVQDFLKFEANAQSLRLVAKLQVLADYNGLNLTFGTLSALCKYIATSDQADPVGSNHSRRKPGYFASENELIKLIREETGTGLARNPITYLVEAADDIVYSVADVEDGVKKGVITWEKVRENIHPEKDATAKLAIEGMERILRAGSDKLPVGLQGEDYASAFRTAAIGILIRSVTEVFKLRYESIMAGEYEGDLVEDCNAAGLVNQLKSIGRTSVYNTAPTLKLEIVGRKVIGDLMTIFWEGAKNLPLDKAPDTRSYEGKIGALLSENYRRVFIHFAKENQNLPETYHRFQLVTDYVCGMTDSFAKRLHAELTNGA